MTTDDRDTTDRDFKEVWCEIIERAWADEEFKGRLMANPNQVMADYRFPAPEGMHFTVVENAPNELTVVLPASPERRRGVAPEDDRTVNQYHTECV